MPASFLFWTDLSKSSNNEIEDRNLESESLPLSEPPAIPQAPSRITWLPTSLSSLRHRNYRLFFAGQLISLTGSMMQGAAIGWIVYEITKSKEQLGIIRALSTVPIMLFAVLGGVIADRYPKRAILLYTQTTAMVLALLMSVLAFNGLSTVWPIAVIGALGGLVMAFDIPARQAFVAEMVGRDDLQNAIVLNSSMFNAAAIIGPAVGGLLMRWGAGYCFLINGLSFLAVIAGLLMMRLAPHKGKPSGVSAMKQAAEGFSIVSRRPALRGLLAFIFVTGIFGFSYHVLMPVFARDILRADEAGYGLLLSAGGVGAILGAVVLATLSHMKRRANMIIAGVILFSVMLFLFGGIATPQFAALKLAAAAALAGLTGSAATAWLPFFFLSDFDFWFAIPCLMGAGMGTMLMASTSNTLLQHSVPHEARGRVMGVWALIFVGATPIGSLVAGYAAHTLGAPLAVQLGACICGACGLIAMRALSRMRANGGKPE